VPEYHERKSYAEMTGELIREAALLFGVFLLLDVGLAAWEGELSMTRWEATLLIVADLFGTALVAFSGMVLERWR
jgi:hypothetical protein